MCLCFWGVSCWRVTTWELWKSQSDKFSPVFYLLVILIYLHVTHASRIQCICLFYFIFDCNVLHSTHTMHFLISFFVYFCIFLHILIYLLWAYSICLYIFCIPYPFKLKYLKKDLNFISDVHCAHYWIHYGYMNEWYQLIRLPIFCLCLILKLPKSWLESSWLLHT